MAKAQSLLGYSRPDYTHLDEFVIVSRVDQLLAVRTTLEELEEDVSDDFERDLQNALISIDRIIDGMIADIQARETTDDYAMAEMVRVRLSALGVRRAPSDEIREFMQNFFRMVSSMIPKLSVQPGLKIVRPSRVADSLYDGK